MPIGRFARSCRLTVKALRHYDELDLLRPAFVDAETGYRYYRREQGRTAVTIAMLRSLNVPLSTIRDVLRAGSPGDIKALLGAERLRIERELARSRQALLTIDRVVQSGELLPYAIAVREEPERLLMTLTGTIRDEYQIEDSTALTYRLLDLVAAAGISWSRPVLCLLSHPLSEGSVEITAGVVLDKPQPGVGDAVALRLAGGPCAVLTHMGPYESISMAHYALSAWVHEHDCTEAGALREYYLNDPREVSPEAIATEVVLPIKAWPP